MINLRTILNTVIFPKLHAIEESPQVTVLSMSEQDTSNPFSGGGQNESYDVSTTVNCIYSEQPEVVSSGNNVITQKVIYFYIKSEDIENLSLRNRFVFRENRYKAVDIQNIFGLWKVKVLKS